MRSQIALIPSTIHLNQLIYRDELILWHVDEVILLIDIPSVLASRHQPSWEFPFDLVLILFAIGYVD